jgi:hypothetical protein
MVVIFGMTNPWFFVWFEIPVDTITIKTSKYNSIVSTMDYEIGTYTTIHGINMPFGPRTVNF